MSGIDEQLAVSVALKKLATQAETAAKAAIVERYRDNGIKALDLMVGGRKCGTLSIKNNDGPCVTDEQLFADWSRATYTGMVSTVSSRLNLDLLTPEQFAMLCDAAEEIRPGCVERTYTIDEASAKHVLDGLREGPNGECVTADGEIASGVQWRRSATVYARSVDPVEVNEALRLSRGVDVIGMLEAPHER